MKHFKIIGSKTTRKFNIEDDEMKYKIEEQYPDVYCNKSHIHTKRCLQ